MDIILQNCASHQRISSSFQDLFSCNGPMDEFFTVLVLWQLRWILLLTDIQNGFFVKTGLFEMEKSKH